MVEQELKEIWRNSSQIEQIKFDISRLLRDLDKRAKKLDQVIKNRDRREIAASVFGVIMFGYFAIAIPFWITKIGALLSVLWFIYIIFKFRNNRKTKAPVDLTLPYKEQLHRQRKNIEQEAAFLNSVLYWYVLPPLIANLVFIFGVGDPSAYNWEPGFLDFIPFTMNSKITMSIGIILFSAFVVWLNKRAVKKTLTPIIKEIDRIESQLENNL
ncbi:hypothetical protein [Roseivirga misakiensis]|uniref:Uncharacterized protein n=1 Tax=Roseivirga misakiensis TaxID=1563681 RepID=A0A1E5SYN6_9BACT|nr:hypothetical protein [Roseivirga misakiensis]OEK04226.1 hypothetical protein BFP71_12135 [Roseivirga misakiensis]